MSSTSLSLKNSIARLGLGVKISLVHSRGIQSMHLSKPFKFYLCEQEAVLFFFHPHTSNLTKHSQTASGYIDIETSGDGFQRVGRFAIRRRHFCISLPLGFSLTRALIIGGRMVLELDQ